MHVRTRDRPRPGSPSGSRRRTWSSTCSASTARTSPPDPLAERRELLEGLGLSGTWQVPASYDDGAMLLDATLQQGLEGVVSKRLSSRYTFDARSPHWLKLAHRHRCSYVVGGWRPQEGTSDRLAALLVGEPTPDGLIYRGRVGSGIGGAASRLLTDLLAGSERDASPFADEVPAGRRHAAPAGSSRSWWSTSTPTAGRRASGCGSRRTGASAPTSAPTT